MIRTWNKKTPTVHETAWVCEMAYVVGDVEIGEGSSVFPGCVLRGDRGKIKVARDTHIQDGTIIHASPHLMEIGSHNNIGHGVVIHARKIGDHCLIGNNSTLLEQVEISDHCIVGANAMVRRGMKVPPYSFVVGVPAEIRPLSEQQRVRVGNLTGNFGELIRQYKADGL